MKQLNESPLDFCQWKLDEEKCVMRRWITKSEESVRSHRCRCESFFSCPIQCFFIHFYHKKFEFGDVACVRTKAREEKIFRQNRHRQQQQQKTDSIFFSHFHLSLLSLLLIRSLIRLDSTAARLLFFPDHPQSLSSSNLNFSLLLSRVFLPLLSAHSPNFDCWLCACSRL